MTFKELAHFAKPTKRLNLRVLKLPFEVAWYHPFSLEEIEKAVSVWQ